jgi:hypothetical protein
MKYCKFFKTAWSKHSEIMKKHCQNVTQEVLMVLITPLPTWVKMCNKEPKRASNVKHNQSKSNIIFLLLFVTIVIMAS